MRSNERSECIKSLIKLKQQEEAIEKTLDNFVNSMKLEPGILRVLQNERHSFASDRKKMSNTLRASALEITNELRTIQSLISGMQEGHKIDVDSFKGKLINLADKIRDFKKNCPLEDLTQEEIELDEYLHEFSLISTKYEGRKNSTSSVTSSRETSKKDCNTCAVCQDYRDIRDFESLVSKTGHTENWSEEDHLFFLKVRKTCRNVPAIVAEIRKKCPDITAERIVNHEAWYKIYLELREKQRKIIKDWRKKKELEKRHKVENTKEENKALNSKGKISVSEIITTESDPAEGISKSTLKSTKPKESFTNHKKETLTQWRVNKQNARALEDEQRKLESESRRIRKENRRLTRARELKAAVSAYREKKMENLISSSTTSFTDSDRMSAKSEGCKLIKSFRRQDEEFLERRKALLASKKTNSGVLVRHKIRARSDEHSTLLKPTKVWLEKCKQDENNSEESQQFLFVKDIPKLATCNWRNRESS